MALALSISRKCVCTCTCTIVGLLSKLQTLLTKEETSEIRHQYIQQGITFREQLEVFHFEINHCDVKPKGTHVGFAQQALLLGSNVEMGPAQLQ